MQDLGETLRLSEARLSRMEQQLQGIEAQQRFQMTIISLMVLLGQFLWSCMCCLLAGSLLTFAAVARGFIHGKTAAVAASQDGSVSAATSGTSEPSKLAS